VRRYSTLNTQLRIFVFLLWALPPLACAILAIGTPSYFAMMMSTTSGAIAVGGAIVAWLLAGACYVAIVRAVRLQRLQPRVAPVWLLLPTMLLVFPALFTVLLGPALIRILAH
jgi:hypothetical protein